MFVIADLLRLFGQRQIAISTVTVIVSKIHTTLWRKQYPNDDA